ncbi:MAG: restriction endonuclease subunit S [Odoribacter splanchnicus]|jgi:TYPE I RESTRICTION-MODIFICATION SYSTEM SPECIFICITY SUBUNIT|uniref:restriction endonuclease subunit S n=1 Tax=Odoribacter splanchnicus TaxID=28118 RepID=UPI001585AF2B|nr:restriction endonuclease subunit S [Odoribacter splanchnicus]MBV4276968.1 restriction endonuclease subunit S [Odoribacter splanchnicus]MBV4292187.1 restriction endonuclease subunit S [Odoribacter splanchnicus]MBV4401850.1 restriction endonuclease subunit S [Odoribacter splanchnicus]MBV4410509.1 restriction endonuclease subunit S [Odoribacter splanchnicus]MDB9229597.1 restriction endonuclease subunit S [Odoribacter splanchnicus]
MSRRSSDSWGRKNDAIPPSPCVIIPIPSMTEQKRIAAILDRFDRLTNDLSQGLPAEIEKRRQQYEYYRDKLLTFKRKGA